MFKKVVLLGLLSIFMISVPIQGANAAKVTPLWKLWLSKLCPASACSFWSLTVINKGAVVPEPVLTTINANSNGSLTLKQVQIKNTENCVEKDMGTWTAKICEKEKIALKNWTAKLSEADLESLNTLIKDANILNQGDITKSENTEPCAGGMGYSFNYVTSEGDFNQFLISGAVICNDELIPEKITQIRKLLFEGFMKTYKPAE